MLLLHIAEVATGGISQVSGSAIIDQMFLTDARLEKRADQGSDFQSLGKKRSLKYCMPHYPFGMACSESMGGRHVPTSRRQSGLFGVPARHTKDMGVVSDITSKPLYRMHYQYNKTIHKVIMFSSFSSQCLQTVIRPSLCHTQKQDSSVRTMLFRSVVHVCRSLHH